MSFLRTELGFTTILTVSSFSAVIPPSPYHTYPSNELNQSILRERLYTAILDYFCVSAQWPSCSTTECLADVEVLDKFWDTLVHVSYGNVMSWK